MGWSSWRHEGSMMNYLKPDNLSASASSSDASNWSYDTCTLMTYALWVGLFWWRMRIEERSRRGRKLLPFLSFLLLFFSFLSVSFNSFHFISFSFVSFFFPFCLFVSIHIISFLFFSFFFLPFLFLSILVTGFQKIPTASTQSAKTWQSMFTLANKIILRSRFMPSTFEGECSRDLVCDTLLLISFCTSIIHLMPIQNKNPISF